MGIKITVEYNKETVIVEKPGRTSLYHLFLALKSALISVNYNNTDDDKKRQGNNIR